MPRGGYRPGSGRKKGSKNANKTDQNSLKNVKNDEIEPLEYMLSVVNDPLADPERRDRMAIAAAPYRHSKVSEKSKKTEKKELSQQAASGRFSPMRPPKLKAIK